MGWHPAMGLNHGGRERRGFVTPRPWVFDFDSDPDFDPDGLFSTVLFIRTSCQFLSVVHEIRIGFISFPPTSGFLRLMPIHPTSDPMFR